MLVSLPVEVEETMIDTTERIEGTDTDMKIKIR